MNGSRGTVESFDEIDLNNTKALGANTALLRQFFRFTSAKVYLPVVLFATGERAQIVPVQWDIRDPGTDKLVTFRQQIPLKLAWYASLLVETVCCFVF